MLYVRKDMELTDLQLCKLWFLCLYGNYDLPKKLTEIPKDLLETVKLNRVNTCKLVDREILKIGNSWFVGDGFGNITYSPNRQNSDYLSYVSGDLPILEKYEVIIGDK